MTQKKEWNFDLIINRRGTNSVKWSKQFLKRIFGEIDDDFIPLWVADMDFNCPPCIKDEIIKRAEHQLYGYTFTKKNDYQSLISWYILQHNWEIENQWICATPGVIPAINFIIQKFSDPGDKIILQTPVYYPFFEAIKNNTRQIVENPLIWNKAQYTMDLKDFETKIQDPRVKLVILCNPHNPIGRVWTKRELIELGDICIKYEKIIISDEIHCDLIMPGYKHTCFASISDEFANIAITCNSISKTFNLAGLKHSNIIIPNEKLRNEFKSHLKNLGLEGSSLFGKIAAQIAYKEGKKWLDDLILYVHANFRFLKETLSHNLPKINVIELQATYLVWLDFNQYQITEEKLNDLIVKKAKIGLDDGKWFGKEGKGFKRINIACPRGILEEAINRLISAMKSIEI